MLLVLCVGLYWLWPRGSIESPVTTSPRASVAETRSPQSQKSEPAKAKISLRQTIEENQLCDAKGNYLAGEISLEEKYRALVKANHTKTDPCSLALLAKTKKLGLKYSGKSNDPECQFLQALFLTGQIEMGTEIKDSPSSTELKTGMDALEALSKSDPGNGIYPFFYLGAANKGNISPLSMEEMIDAFLQMTHFQSPILKSQIEFRELGHLNPSAMLYAVELSSGHSYPNYGEGLIFLRLLSKTERYQFSFAPWAAELQREMQATDEAAWQEPYVSLLEFAILKGIAASWWTKFREEPLPVLLSQEGFKQFYHRRLAIGGSEQNEKRAQDISEILSKDTTTCQSTFAAMQDYFPGARDYEREKLEAWQRAH